MSVDAAVRDVLYAVRTFRRAPLAAITIVATVALGLGLVAVIFTLLNSLLFHVDAVRDVDELFAVERPKHLGSDENIPFTRSQYEALRRETDVFSDVFAIMRGVSTRTDGHAMNANLVTGNFFQVLGVNPAVGRTLLPSDDEPGGGRPVIVLGHRAWTRWYDRDPAVVGRTVRIGGQPFEIVGVAAEGFRGLAIGSPAYWAPLSLAGRFRRASVGKEDEIPIDVIGRLKPGLSPEKAAAGLEVWAADKKDRNPASLPPAGIRLEARRGTVVDDISEVLLVFTPLFFAFGLILMIGCANVANLLLARGLSRQREIGIRLSLGASRRRILRQLLTESLLLALVSAALGYAVSRILLATTIYAATATMPLEIGEVVGRISAPAADWRVVLFLVAGALASTVFFGLAPALQATRLELVRTMRGEVTRDARPGRARNALIAVQVGASALLLICAAVFLRSAWAASSADVGFRIQDTVSVEVATESLRTAVVSAVRGHASVAAVAASRPPALATPPAAFAETSSPDPASASAAPRRWPVGYRFVSSEYFGVLDIPVLRGRGFTLSERTGEAGVAIVSDTAARKLWPDGTALGQPMRLEPQSDSPRTVTIVGVVRDVPGFQLSEWPRAVVYLPTSLDSAATVLTLRVHGDPAEVRAVLFDWLATVDPAIDQISTLRMQAGLGVYLMLLVFWVTVVLAGLALALTLSGLFSVLSYVVEQRTREIGVRMALGATKQHVTRLVLSQLLRQVAIGLVVGSGLAAALAAVLLSNASEIAGVVHVLDPVAYAVSGLCIVSACLVAAWVPARRAAGIDPIATLRRD